MKSVPTFASQGMIVRADSAVEAYIYVEDANKLNIYKKVTLEEAQFSYKGNYYTFLSNAGEIVKPEDLEN